jgi:4-alpha-glucanotransferase
MYSADGQDWGLPLYNWSNMELDGYRWWKARLAVASQYFHIYRIDHIVGFFRVWAVPHHKKATEGHYEPKDESTWIPNGKKFMKVLLESCEMLPIGEDLGTVPPEVRKCLQQLVSALFLID